MKKFITILLAAVMLLSLTACAKTASPQAQAEEPQAEQTSPDADWLLPENVEMTEELEELFSKATEGLVGVSYEPLGMLGEKDGVYCFLCRAAAVYPGAKPYYALVYVKDQSVQNIWDIWMGAHAEKKA